MRKNKEKLIRQKLKMKKLKKKIRSGKMIMKLKEKNLKKNSDNKSGREKLKKILNIGNIQADKSWKVTMAYEVVKTRYPCLIGLLCIKP